MNRGDRLMVESIAVQVVALGRSRLHEIHARASAAYKTEDLYEWQEAFAEAIVRDLRRTTRRKSWLKILSGRLTWLGARNTR